MDAPRTWIFQRVLLVTLISIAASVAITLAITWFFTGAFQLGMGLFIAIFAPAVIAPVGSYQYISLTCRLRTANEQLRVLSEIDSLTGALNRRRFLELSEQQLSLAARHGYPTSLLVIDFDHFKQVNDRYGHAGGDRVLVEITEVIRRTIRDSDLLGRVGGEEFALLLPHTAGQGAALLAERVVQAIRATAIDAADVSIQVTVSIGGATCESSRTPLDQLLHSADEQLYEAKQAGRNRVHISPAAGDIDRRYQAAS
ncbi:MAG: GGDEF domain-containing protein [Pseudomonadales bacterium]|nr:GGDEF domain-containing protein [Pseudomonadales bacterium]